MDTNLLNRDCAGRPQVRGKKELRWGCNDMFGDLGLTNGLFLLFEAKGEVLLKRAARTPPGLYKGDVASWSFEAESWKVDKSKCFDKDHSSIENQTQTFNIYALNRT